MTLCLFKDKLQVRIRNLFEAEINHFLLLNKLHSAKQFAFTFLGVIKVGNKLLHNPITDK